MVRKHSSVLFLTVAVAGGNYYAMAMTLIAGVVVGRYVDPEVLGKFGAFALVLGYIPFLQVGVLNGLNRELPYYIGKGETDRVQDLAAAGQFWACLLGTLVGMTLVVMGVWNAIGGNWENAVGWWTYAVLGFLLFYNTNYLQLTYRTSHDFARLAIAKVFESTTGVALIVLVVWWGFYGLCIKALMAALVGLGILYCWRPIRVWPKWNWNCIKHLFKIGCPIFIVGQIYAYWAVIVSTWVLSALGKEGMGLYTVVTMATVAMETIPLAIGQIIYPRMAQEWGREPSVGGIIRVAYKPVLFSFLGMIPCMVIAYFCVEPAVKLLLPKYVGAIPAIKWSIWLGLIVCLQPVNNVFNVVRKQVMYLTAILIGMASTFISLKLLLMHRLSLAAFPQALLIGKSIFMICCYFFVWLIWQKQHTHGD